jgi:hypothetical protein
MSPAFERLEDRVLLAATAELNGTTLVITYTGADIDVVLDGSAEGAITVAGTDADDGPFTGVKSIKIVGTDDVNEIRLLDIDITGNVTADMKGGDDSVIIDGLTTIDGSVTIKTGDGDDDVGIDGDNTGNTIDIGKNVKVDLGDAGAGTDLFYIYGDTAGEEITIGGGVTVKGKGGDQRFELDLTDIAKNLNVNLGDGDDEVAIGTFMDTAGLEVNVGGNATIKTGDGDDFVDINVSGGGTVAFVKNLKVDLGNAGAGGDQFTALADTAVDDIITVGGSASVKGKGGIQRLDIDFIAVTKNVNINLGDDNDSVAINQASAGLITTVGGTAKINLGAGEDDELFVEDTTVTGKATIDGGKGGSDEADETTLGTFLAAPGSISKNFEVGSLV